MKKLQLKALSLGATEILSREQMKGIEGGACSGNTDCHGGWCDGGTCKALGNGSDPSTPCGTDEYPCGYCGCQTSERCSQLHGGYGSCE